MRIRALIAAAALAVGSSVAAAGVTQGNFITDATLHGRGSFNGTATYDSSTEKLTLVVNNTSSAANGGYLTAVAFDITGTNVAKYEDPDGGRKPNTNGYDDLIKGRRKTVQTTFGKYEGGAGLDGAWAAGKVTRGIAAGHSQTFVFDVTGPNAASLNVGDFFSGGTHGLNIVASFAGMSHHRTDRAGGALSGFAVIDPLATNNDGNTTPPGGTTKTPPSNGSGVPTPPPGAGGITGNNDGGNTGASAVPLPPGAWTALSTFGLMGLGAIRRRVRAMIA